MTKPRYRIISHSDGNWIFGSAPVGCYDFYSAFPNEDLARQWLDAILIVAQETLPLAVKERWEWDFAATRKENYGEFVMSCTPEEKTLRLRFLVHNLGECSMDRAEIPVIDYPPKDLTIYDAYRIIKLTLPFWNEANTKERLQFAYHFYNAIRSGEQGDIFITNENAAKIEVPKEFQDIIQNYHGDMHAGLENECNNEKVFAEYDHPTPPKPRPEWLS